MKKKLIVLAFDIEATGQNLGKKGVGQVIALGMCVLDDNLKKIDGCTIGAYRKKMTSNQDQFEKRCWDEFWSKNEDLLEMFRFDPKIPMKVRRRQLVDTFQTFRRKWELFAIEKGFDYEIVSDNTIYDGEKMNQLISTETEDIVLPYSASRYATQDDPNLLQRYNEFTDTTSMKKGFLIGYNYGKKNKIVWKDIEKEFDIPPAEFEHDHMPENDAYTIARDRQIINGIDIGKFKKLTIDESNSFTPMDLIVFLCLLIAYIYFLYFV
jgi:hypothetical protein